MRKKIVLSTTSFSLFFTIIVASLYRNVITLIHLYVKIDIGRLTSNYLQRNNFQTEIAFIYIYTISFENYRGRVNPICFTEDRCFLFYRWRKKKNAYTRRCFRRVAALIRAPFNQ